MTTVRCSLSATATAEATFVILCTREPSDATALAEAAATVRDWQTVADLTARHRVAAYVLVAAARDAIAIPKPAFAALWSDSIGNQAVAMLLESELKRIVTSLAEASVPVLVLKGPALARTIYSAPAFRPFADLDLAVQVPHERQAASILLDLGYTELEYETEAWHRAHVGHDHAGTLHRLLAGANDRALVELHLDPLQLGVAPVCEAVRWARASPVPDLNGARMLGPEDQIVQLSVHAQKHGYSRLIWLKDLDQLLRAGAGTLDWSLIVDVARREGVAASVWYSLQLTSMLLGSPVSDSVTEALRPALPVRLLTEWCGPPDAS